MPSQNQTVKCVMVGDGGVGKTTYLRMLQDNVFEPKYISTLGVEVQVIDIGDVRFNVWDTAGQEKFRGLGDGYYIQASCGIVCFDLGSRLTFKNTEFWIKAMSTHTSKLVLVGFKSDINPKVSQSDIMNLSAKYNIPYFEVSTKNKVGMYGPFEHLKTLLC